MIGLMYLVLTAMLALNVSKQILQGYLSVNESLDKSKRNVLENNQRVTSAFESALAGSPGAKPYFEQAQIAQKEIRQAFAYLDEVKGNVIRYVLKMPETAKVKGDTVNLRWGPVMDKIDNYDMPTYLLGVAEPNDPKDGPLTAKELRGKLNELHDKLMKQVESMQKGDNTKLLPEDFENLKKKIAIIKPTDSGREEDGIKFTWPLDNFYHLPMAAVFVNLQKMQLDLANVEAEILQVFSSASGKLAIKPDRLVARAIAPASYVSAGSPYVADIYLSAAFTKLGAGDMEVMLGVDSASAAKGAKGEPVPVVAGMGRYEVQTRTPGDFEYKGVIKIKKPDGTFEYFPFNATYKVAQSAASVSAEQMMVFYRGVVNPVAASAAGIAPGDIVLSATGSGVKFVPRGEPGKYNFTFSGIGECMVTVSAKTPDGVKTQGPPFKFRVKPLPKPEARIGGKFAPDEMKKSELATVGAIGAGASGFDFQANYVTQEYEILGRVRGKTLTAEGKGANLNAEALNIIRGADINSKLFIDIKVKGPDGLKYSSSCAIKVVR